MAILDFQRPDKVIMIESDNRKGKFEFRPLEPGYGITIGNSLRRILLSSLEGFAITSIKIDGVNHEFSTIPGVVEDVTEMILNLKKVRLSRQIDSVTSEKVVVSLSGGGAFTAGNIGKFTSAFQVLNPDLVICNLDPKVKVNMEITIDGGRGYRPADENKELHNGIDVVCIDSIFTPIVNVKYNIENYRVEQKTDFENLLIEVETDGSIEPKEALKEAAKILIQHFALFSDDKITLDLEEKVSTEEFDEESMHMRQLLKTKLTDLDLSVRALNCLKAADVETIGELVSFNKTDLLKFRNFGRKSLVELEDLVKDKGLQFGMNVAKYKLDKD
ncbi:MAG: DNA-directed RNA polymerase subunit alpha [Flavobacteriales bacterium]